MDIAWRKSCWALYEWRHWKTWIRVNRHSTKEEPIDFGQRGVILRLGEVRSFIRKAYIHSSAEEDKHERQRT